MVGKGMSERGRVRVRLWGKELSDGNILYLVWCEENGWMLRFRMSEGSVKFVRRGYYNE